VDVIHTHLLGPAVYGTLAARIVGQPLVATMHGSVDLSVAEKWWGLKARVLSRRRNRFVAVTESLRAEMAETLSLPLARIRVIANGVDPAQFYPARDYALRGQFGWGESAIVVGSVGNVRRPKGYHDLLEAAALVRDKSPACRFVIVGDTSGEPELYRTLLEHREALGLDEFVAFAGFRDDISRCLNSLDIYVMSSVKEGLPLAILQAMASRLPIVATRSGGPQEILTHNQDALLVSPSDPQALAHAILQLADCTDLRRRLATAAHDLVTSRYTLDQTANEYQEVYSECLSSET
jgi:glycosyltransferase involved in cell wall biosynthesis